MSTQLRAWWPIHELADDLIAQAERELPAVALRAHARLTGSPRWSVVPGELVPGARAYAWVLVAHAPAVHVDNIAAARRAWQRTRNVQAIPA